MSTRERRSRTRVWVSAGSTTLLIPRFRIPLTAWAHAKLKAWRRNPYLCVSTTRFTEIFPRPGVLRRSAPRIPAQMVSPSRRRNRAYLSTLRSTIRGWPAAGRIYRHQFRRGQFNTFAVTLPAALPGLSRQASPTTAFTHVQGGTKEDSEWLLIGT